MRAGLQRASDQIRPVLQSMNNTKDDDILVFDNVHDVVAPARHETKLHTVDEVRRDHIGMSRQVIQRVQY